MWLGNGTCRVIESYALVYPVRVNRHYSAGVWKILAYHYPPRTNVWYFFKKIRNIFILIYTLNLQSTVHFYHTVIVLNVSLTLENRNYKSITNVGNSFVDRYYTIIFYVQRSFNNAIICVCYLNARVTDDNKMCLTHYTRIYCFYKVLYECKCNFKHN